MTTITDDDGNKRDFAFDYSFWSHDGFRTRSDGYAEPEEPRYVDQRAIYNEVSFNTSSNILAWQKCA